MVLRVRTGGGDVRPRVYTITVAKNEDSFLGHALDSWAKHAYDQYVLDTGSIDNTMDEIEACDKRRKAMADRTAGMTSWRRMATVGESMVARQWLLDKIPASDEGDWVVILDADELYGEPEIEALLRLMADPEIDYIGTRPIPLGWDCSSVFYTAPLEPFDPADRFDPRLTTPYWCPRVTIHAMRRTRLQGVSDPNWGTEVFWTPFDIARHRPTDDMKPAPVPSGGIPVQFTGRTAWTDIHYWHLSYLTRSSRWRDIEQIPNSNAMDRCRARAAAQYPLPSRYSVPEFVRKAVATLERPW